MSTQILTLFGDDFAPEPIKQVPKLVKADIPAPQSPELPVKKAAQKKVVKDVATPLKKEKANKKNESSAGLLDGWDASKQYYSIGEVSTLFHVKTSHIRFWTNEFGIKVRTTRKGDRLYTPEQIREIHTIYHLVKEVGFTIAGAKAKLKERGKIVEDTFDLKKSMLKLRNQLLNMRNQLA